MLEAIVVARYEPRGRGERLHDANLRLERMRHLLRLALGAHACPFTVFEWAMRALDDAGRMLHGWREKQPRASAS